MTASLLLCACVSPSFDATKINGDSGAQDAQAVVGAEARQTDAQQADAQQPGRADATASPSPVRDAGNPTSTPAACVVGQSKLSDCILR